MRLQFLWLLRGNFSFGSIKSSSAHSTEGFWARYIKCRYSARFSLLLLSLILHHHLLSSVTSGLFRIFIISIYFCFGFLWTSVYENSAENWWNSSFMNSSFIKRYTNTVIAEPEVSAPLIPELLIRLNLEALPLSALPRLKVPQNQTPLQLFKRSHVKKFVSQILYAFLCLLDCYKHSKLIWAPWTSNFLQWWETYIRCTLSCYVKPCLLYHAL
jgi:hypothetical protein